MTFESIRSYFGACAVACALGLGCGDEAQARRPAGPGPLFSFEVSAEVELEEGGAAPGVPIMLTLADHPPSKIGYTDRDGRLVVAVEAHHDTPISLAVGKSEDYVFASGSELIDERLIVRRKGQELHAMPVVLRAQVRSRANEYLVWVRAECGEGAEPSACAGLPVRLDGRELARTDPSGRADLVVPGTPGTEVEIEIGSKDSALTPIDPVWRTTLGKRPEILTLHAAFTPEQLEQEEEEVAAPPIRKAKRRKRATKRRKKRSSKGKRRAKRGTKKVSKGTPKTKREVRPSTKKKALKKKKSSGGAAGTALF